MIKTLNAIRYVTPLREGGSLPAIVEADNHQLYVMKFVGAGQGRKALVAELVAGEIGRALGLNVPELAFINLDAELGPSEPDPEIFDLLRFSVGLNLAMGYLPNAFMFNALSQPQPSADLASRIVWFDAYVTNMDRTPRNTNILIWQNALWLIDHGAALYFHHSWQDYLDKSRTPFAMVQDHTLLRWASQIEKIDAESKTQLTRARIAEIVALIPDAWLDGDTLFANHAEHRAAYTEWLNRRLEASQVFVQEAINARARLV
jgi:hypothetical protein